MVSFTYCPSEASDASVEASAIPIFRTGWGTKGSQGTAHSSRVLMPASMLLGGIFPMRVRRAIALYRFRFQPDLPTEEGSESSMDGYIPYVPRTKRDRWKPRRDKHITVDEDVVDRQFYPDNILKDYLDSQAGGSNDEQFNLDGLSEFDFPPTIGGSEEVSDFSKAARMVDGVELRNVEKRISLDEVTIVSEDSLNRGHLAPGEDDPHRGQLAHGRGRPAPRSPRPWARTHRGHLAHRRGQPASRSPRPWARTTRTEVTLPMGEEDPRQGHLAHGRGRPAPRSPRPWARTTRTEVTSPMGEDRPPFLKPCILV
ncbi:hypothetical protein Bca101_050565 [Brassica carinata]